MKAVKFFDIKKAYGFVFFYSFLVLINRLKVGVIWAFDTQQYIDKSVIRPPVYPLAISFFKMFFEPHAFIALIFFQLIFVLIAAFYLSNLLRKKFELHPITFTLLHLFLLLPLSAISVAVGIHGEIGNKLLTEALSYGLFLLAVSFLVKTLFTDERRNLIIFILLIGILTLIRTQMIFMYIIAIVAINILQFKVDHIRSIIILITTGIAIFVFADLSERFYHKAANHYFGKVSLNASHILVGAIYVTNEKVINNIVNQQDREVIKRTYDYLENKKLLAKNRFEIDRRLVDLYNDNFAIILGSGLMASFQHVYSLPKQEDEMLIQFESFSRRVIKILICHNYKEFSKLMLLKFLYTLNFREGFFIALFLFLPFIRLSHEFKIFAFFIFLMLVSNRLIMTPIIYIGDRYLFYTDILEYVIFIIMAEKYLKRYVFRVDESFHSQRWQSQTVRSSTWAL
ncbi:MAG: hypothetical protein EHM85_02740 [Desulfobacteraceae bacterium]|nr:MAG: hypothetical protein EHM85_02740 [Desulfobacteraceae bacterium]